LAAVEISAPHCQFPKTVAAKRDLGQLEGSHMKRISLLIAGAALMLSAAAGTAIAETPNGGDALQAVSANLPVGVTVQNATERQLSSAVRRTVRAHPELSGDIVKEVSEVVPARKQVVSKAVSAAKAPYARTTGRGGKL
jgi:hypothetical protein